MIVKVEGPSGMCENTPIATHAATAAAKGFRMAHVRAGVPIPPSPAHTTGTAPDWRRERCKLGRLENSNARW